MYDKKFLAKKYWEEGWETALSFEEFVYYMNQKKSNFIQEHWDLYEIYDDFGELDELPRVEKIKKPAVKARKLVDDTERGDAY